MAIARDALPALELPTEAVAMPSLGGDVLARGMDMQQLLEFVAARRRLSEPRAGETQAEANERAGAELVPFVLGMCAVLDDGKPAYSEQQWRVFGVKHADEMLTLFAVVMRLSGMAGDEKKD